MRVCERESEYEGENMYACMYVCMCERVNIREREYVCMYVYVCMARVTKDLR